MGQESAAHQRWQHNVIPTRAVCAVAAIVSTVLLWSITFQQAGATAVITMFAIAAAAAVHPYETLLLIAGLGPLVTIIQILMGDSQVGVRFAEALMLAFIAGATLRRAIDGRRFAVPSAIVWLALVLIAAAVASAVVQAAVLGVEQPALNTWGHVPMVLIRDYLFLRNGVTDAILFAEGPALLVLTADLTAGEPARRDRVLRLMVTGAAAAALLNLVRIVEAALTRGHFWSSFLTLFAQSRVNVHFGDWNAAASHFGMMIFIAVAAARRRPVYGIMAALLAAAVWLTGSRTAMASIVLVAAAWAVLSLRHSKRRTMWTVAAVALVIGAGAAGWKWYPSKRNDPAAFSLTSRLEMSRAGVRMALTQPVFGVGIGRYYVLSSQFADPKLLAYMWRPHENAHNYFVQVLAEMGFPGLLLFGTLIVLTLNQAAGAQPRAPGLFAGLIVFLLTCCAGHPLLTPQVAYPFWIAMGLAAAPFGEARPLRNGWRALAGAALVFLAVTVPLRARDAVRHANLAATTMGLSLWNWHDQVRFRWAGTRSTQFFSSAARTIRIPLQCGPDAPSDLEIRLFIDNHEADRVHLPADGRWHDVRFVLGAPGETDFRRFDVEVRSADGRPLDTASTQLLMVGEPSIVWGQ